MEAKRKQLSLEDRLRIREWYYTKPAYQIALDLSLPEKRVVNYIYGWVNGDKESCVHTGGAIGRKAGERYIPWTTRHVKLLCEIDKSSRHWSSDAARMLGRTKGSCASKWRSIQQEMVSKPESEWALDYKKHIKLGESLRE